MATPEPKSEAKAASKKQPFEDKLDDAVVVDRDELSGMTSEALRNSNRPSITQQATATMERLKRFVPTTTGEESAKSDDTHLEEIDKDEVRDMPYRGFFDEEYYGPPGTEPDENLNQPTKGLATRLLDRLLPGIPQEWEEEAARELAAAKYGEKSQKPKTDDKATTADTQSVAAPPRKPDNVVEEESPLQNASHKDQPTSETSDAASDLIDNYYAQHTELVSKFSDDSSSDSSEHCDYEEEGSTQENWLDQRQRIITMQVAGDLQRRWFDKQGRQGHGYEARDFHENVHKNWGKKAAPSNLSQVTDSPEVPEHYVPRSTTPIILPIRPSSAKPLGADTDDLEVPRAPPALEPAQVSKRESQVTLKGRRIHLVQKAFETEGHVPDSLENSVPSSFWLRLMQSQAQDAEAASKMEIEAIRSRVDEMREQFSEHEGEMTKEKEELEKGMAQLQSQIDLQRLALQKKRQQLDQVTDLSRKQIDELEAKDESIKGLTEQLDNNAKSLASLEEALQQESERLESMKDNYTSMVKQFEEMHAKMALDRTEFLTELEAHEKQKVKTRAQLRKCRDERQRIMEAFKTFKKNYDGACDFQSLQELADIKHKLERIDRLRQHVEHDLESLIRQRLDQSLMISKLHEKVREFHADHELLGDTIKTFSNELDDVKQRAHADSERDTNDYARIMHMQDLQMANLQRRNAHQDQEAAKVDRLLQLVETSKREYEQLRAAMIHRQPHREQADLVKAHMSRSSSSSSRSGNGRISPPTAAAAATPSSSRHLIEHGRSIHKQQQSSAEIDAMQARFDKRVRENLAPLEVRQPRSSPSDDDKEVDNGAEEEIEDDKNKQTRDYDFLEPSRDRRNYETNRPLPQRTNATAGGFLGQKLGKWFR